MFINVETPILKLSGGFPFIKITIGSIKELKIIPYYKSGRQSSIKPSVSTLLMLGKS